MRFIVLFITRTMHYLSSEEQKWRWSSN